MLESIYHNFYDSKIILKSHFWHEKVKILSYIRSVAMGIIS